MDKEYCIKYECLKCGNIEYQAVIPIYAKTVEMNERYCLEDGNMCKRSIVNWTDDGEELSKARNKIINI
jgi:hypothetical protein